MKIVESPKSGVAGWKNDAPAAMKDAGLANFASTKDELEKHLKCPDGQKVVVEPVQHALGWLVDCVDVVRRECGFQSRRELSEVLSLECT